MTAGALAGSRGALLGASLGAPLLTVRGLKKWYPVRDGLRRIRYIKAVDGVSFDIDRGTTVGLVGESGCGKTTTGRVLLRLEEPTAGEVLFEGRDILGLSQHELRALRREMQIVFQDPYSSLDPRKTVADIVGEPLVISGVRDRAERLGEVKHLLEMVGLTYGQADRFPHEFSGGQRQRIAIARALAASPKLIVLDEPVSALDVSIQSQILNLLSDLQRELGVAYLFIGHDLSVVKHVSNRIAVMYLGKIVEFAPEHDLFARPMHPYTQALISAIPVPDPSVKKSRIVLTGDVPSPIDPPAGCRFRGRCWRATDVCAEREPEPRVVGDGHWVACHLYDAAETASCHAGASSGAGAPYQGASLQEDMASTASMASMVSTASMVSCGANDSSGDDVSEVSA